LAQPPDVEALIARLSDGDATVRLDSARELARLGAQPLPRLMGLVGGDDQRIAAGARLTVEGIVAALSAPGAPAGRDEAAQALLDVASRGGSAEARRFALRQLALIGGDGSVPGLALLLDDRDVGELARWTLAEIPGRAATDALIAAASRPDVALRVGVLNALGERGDDAALPVLVEAAGDAEATVRRAALQALGHLPAREAGEPILKALASTDQGAREVAWQAALGHGAALLAAGKSDDAVHLLGEAQKAAATPYERAAALGAWARATGRPAVPQLIEAVRQGPRDERGVAQQVLVELEGVTEAVSKAAESGPAQDRVGLIWVLGERRDATAVPTLASALGAQQDEVKVAALVALGKLRDPATAASIIAALKTGSEPVSQAAEAALGRIPGDEAATALAEAMPGASDTARLSFVRVLGLHVPRASDAALIRAATDPSEDVRVAALEALGRHQAREAVPALIKASVATSRKEAAAASRALSGLTGETVTRAITDALPNASPVERAAVLRALGARADSGLTEAFVRATSDVNEDVVVAALEALGRLHDEKTAPVVLNLAKTGGDKAKSAAILAYLEVGKALAATDRDKALGLFHEALDLAGADDAKVAALGCLAGLGSPESLPRVRPLMEQGSEAVKKAAAGGVVAIAESLVNSGETAQAEGLLTGALPLLQDRALVRRAAAAMRALGKPLAPGAEKGYLTEYWVLGPAGNRGDLRKSDVLPTDARVDVAKPVSLGDQTRMWQFRPTDDPVGHQDLEQAVGQINDTGAYAYVEFEVPEAQEALLKVGSDDDEVTWLNGEEVAQYIGDRGWNADQDSATVQLRAGTNWLLSKVLNGGGQWALSARLTDRDGQPVRAKQWTKTPADIVAERGCVASFWLLGPFAGHDTLRQGGPVDPSTSVDLAQPLTLGDETRSWRWTPVSDVRGMVDLRQTLAQAQNVGCYAYAEVTSDQARDVLLKIGSDDDVYCWLNGELVHENPAARPWAPDQDVVKARLQPGTNRLLLKVLQGGGDWAFSVRMTDLQDNPLVLAQRRP
jgi:HEAT repeat protein